MSRLPMNDNFPRMLPGTVSPSSPSEIPGEKKRVPIWRRLAVGCFLFVLLLVLGAFYLWNGVNSVPQFYEEMAVTEENRIFAEADSDAMESKVQTLRHQLRKDSIWLFEFTQDELNHWLAIAIGEKRPGMLPRRLKNPRGVILEDRILAGVTVSSLEFSGVLSVEVYPRVTAPNVVEVELKNVSAGTVKMPAFLFESLIRRVAAEISFPVEVENRDGKTILRVAFRPGDLNFEGRPIELHTLTIAGKKVLLTGAVQQPVKDMWEF